MIRFHRLLDLASDTDRRRIDAVGTMFRQAFSAEPEAFDRIAAMLATPEAQDHEVLVLLAEDDERRVVGFSVTLYFADLCLGYLYYIASDPERPGRGIGGALYEATRELLIGKGARGLFLDAGPDEASLIDERELLPVNRQRLRFYERYGARPVIGTLYEKVGNPKNEDHKVFLLFDPLDEDRPLRRAVARRFVARMFAAQYGQAAYDAYVRQIVASFADDPVRLREPRYVSSASPTRPRRLLPLKLVVAERHGIHHLRDRGYVERPVRVNAVLRGLESLSVERLKIARYGEEEIRAVHEPRFVDYLKSVCGQLGASEVLYPEVFPIRRPERRPKELRSRAGYYCMDTFTPLTRNVFKAAKAAADCALTAADQLLAGERLAYALVRPPGHHAEPALYGGFCYFNNAAIAANRLSRAGTVALLDIDYHHGNGTQEIFYSRRDVFTLSIHGTPHNSYPHFAGYADERGTGEGDGFNRNFPLPRGVDDTRYLEVLAAAVERIRRFGPAWLVVGLGYDIMRGDPTGSFTVTPAGMRQIGERLGAMRLPTLVVQEGGYTLWNLRTGAHNFFTGLAKAGYYT